VDGYRMVVYKDDDGLRLISRNGRDHSRRFPELVKALGGPKPAGVLVRKTAAVGRSVFCSHHRSPSR
jgi:hypothetical protein